MGSESYRASNGQIFLLLFWIVRQIRHVVEILIAPELVPKVTIDDVFF